MKTTLEKAKENIQDNVATSLQDLLERTYDSEAGYKKAMELAKDKRVVEFLKRRAAQRAQFANQLDKQIRDLNYTPVQDGSTKAAIHRTWMDAKAFISNTTDKAILEECIRGEKSSIETYTDVLIDQNFTPEITNMLHNQLDSIRESLTKVKRLEMELEAVNA